MNPVDNFPHCLSKIHSNIILNLHLGHFPIPKSFQSIRPSPRSCVTFRNMLAFYGEELLAPRTSQLEDHP